MDDRRLFLTTLASIVAGCSGKRQNPPKAERSETEQPRTDSDVLTTARLSETDRTQSGTESRLPKPMDRWTRVSEPEFIVVGNGSYDGYRASYSTSDGRGYDAVVLKQGDVPNTPELRTLGERLACVGWQTVVVTTEQVYAASSGTTTQTQTPEAPPLMDTTPVDDGEQHSSELLALSPELTDEEIRQNSVVCEE